MKLLTKLTLAAAAAAFGTSIAMADDRQVDRRTPERVRAERDSRSTVGVYAERRDVSQRETIATPQPAMRFELRSSSQGQVFGTWVPVK